MDLQLTGRRALVTGGSRGIGKAVAAALLAEGAEVAIAARDPDLVPVLEGAFRYEMEVWVAMHEDLKTSRRMRLMFDWLVEGLGEYVRS